MKNSKEKNKPNVNSTSNNSNNISQLDKAEEEIKKGIKEFEELRRKEFEETLIIQKQALETSLRGENIKYYFDEKNYKIQFVIISSRIKDQPIFGYEFEMDSGVNEFEFAQISQDAAISFLNSANFRNWQKKQYYRLRSQEMEFVEIYPLIEPRYLRWDAIEQKKFRNNLTKDFTRKKAKRNSDKNSKKSPQN